MLDERQVILSKVRLQSSREDYLVAAENLQAGHYKAANNRAYYSIFHAISCCFNIIAFILLIYFLFFKK
jgi:uncharacterized protein (UPF0332 family)